MSAQNSSAARQARFFYAIHLCVVSFFPFSSRLFFAAIFWIPCRKKITLSLSWFRESQKLAFFPFPSNLCGIYVETVGMCDTFLCPAGKTHIADAASTRCDSSTCREEQCCTPSNFQYFILHPCRLRHWIRSKASSSLQLRVLACGSIRLLKVIPGI